MAKENDRTEAVYTEAGLILGTGKPEELKEAYKGRITKEVDLQGAMMLPGLTDSHMHLIGHGEKLLRLDVSKLKSREEVISAVREKCSRTEPGKWVVAEGWNENEWEDSRLILRDELDGIAPDHPLIMKRICRHALCANSAAIQAAGLDEQSAEPAGGVIGHYDSGRLNGLLKEDPAMELIMNSLPGIDQAYVEKALKTAIEVCWKLGLTGVHSEDLNYYNGFSNVLQAYENVVKKGGMPIRANLLVHHETLDEMEAAGLGYRSRKGHIELDAVKIFADGSLGGNTALLSRPYADQPDTSGVAIFTNDELERLVRKARKLGMPVAVHAIGDKAFDNVITVLEAFPPPAGLRDRLIHAQIMREDLLDRAARLPLIFDIQPGFVPSDFPWVLDKVGADEAEFNYAWKTFLGKGIHCAGGSDAPIESADPLLGIHAAVTRRKPYGPDRTVYGEDECLSMYEAVLLYTAGSAYAVGREGERGRIAPGFAADFSVFDQDIFSSGAGMLLKTKAVMTVVGGEPVYSLRNADKTLEQ